MKKFDKIIMGRLLGVLVWLLVAAPGAQAQANAAAAPTGSPGRIIFHGQAPGNTDYGHIDPLNLCPNVLIPGTGVGQPYRFEFNTRCRGNTYNGSRPPFIWTISYLTESGNIYQEKWQDQTLNDYSKVLLYMYDQVPAA